MQPEPSIGSYANNPAGSSLPLRDLESKVYLILTVSRIKIRDSEVRRR